MTIEDVLLEPLPANPQPLGGSAIPPKSRAWRLAATATADLSIEQTDDGYLLVVEYRDGHRIEQDVTEAVRAAAAHEAQNPEIEMALRDRIAELETEIGNAKQWIASFLGQQG